MLETSFAGLIRHGKARCLPQYGNAVWLRYRDGWLRDIAASPDTGYPALADAAIANDRGEFLNALESAARAESLLRKHNPAGLMRAEFERVYALQRLGRGPACLAGAENLRHQLAASSYLWLRVQAELELSACSNMADDPGAAMAAALRAADLAKEAGLGTVQLRAVAFVTALYADLGEANLMWSGTLPALNTFWNGAWRPLRGHAFMANLAASAEQRGKFLAAYVFQREAGEMLATDSNLVLRALAESRLASAASAAGEPEQARRYYLTSAELFNRAGRGAPVEEFRADADLMEASSLLNRGRVREANEMLVSLSRRNPNMPTQLLQIRYDYLRGLALTSLGSGSDAERAFAAAVKTAEKRASSMNKPGERRAALAIAADAWRRLLGAQIDRTRDWNAALEAVDTYRGMTTGGTTAPARRIERSIVYAVLGERIAAWVVAGGQTHGTWLKDSSGEVQRMTRTFLRTCGDRHSFQSVASVQGRRLYEALFANLEEWTGENGTFAVEADDFLGVLPFEALVDGQGRALGERFAFVERESDEERRRLAAGDVPLTTQDATLVIADPALRGAMRISHPALSSAEREGEFVASLFPRTILLAREDATRRNLEKNRPVARLFHFAGHASLTGAGAAVLLAPGEEGEADVLNASAVQARDWTHCELVVLAACSTGLGEDSFSGPPALAQAFLDAGARRVLASRWAVDSETTAAFMKRFYVALAGGESAAQAVRTAATLTRNVSPHPFYWAAFALHGLE